MHQDTERPITVVQTGSGVCLSTVRYDGSTDVQASFADYVTSRGPFDADEAVAYLSTEYPDAAPFSHSDVLRSERRPGTYSWAPSRLLPTGEGLRLGTTNHDSLRLAIAGYHGHVDSDVIWVWRNRLRPQPPFPLTLCVRA